MAAQVRRPDGARAGITSLVNPANCANGKPGVTPAEKSAYRDQSINSSLEFLGLLGRIFDVRQRAATLVADLRWRVDAVRARVVGRPCSRPGRMARPRPPSCSPPTPSGRRPGLTPTPWCPTASTSARSTPGAWRRSPRRSTRDAPRARDRPVPPDPVPSDTAPAARGHDPGRGARPHPVSGRGVVLLAGPRAGPAGAAAGAGRADQPPGRRLPARPDPLAGPDAAGDPARPGPRRRLRRPGRGAEGGTRRRGRTTARGPDPRPHRRGVRRARSRGTASDHRTPAHRGGLTGRRPSAGAVRAARVRRASRCLRGLAGAEPGQALRIRRSE